MLRPLLAGAATCVLLGCTTEDPSPADRRAAFTEDLAGDLVTETDGALGTEQARCVAEALVESVGVDSLDRVVGPAGGEDEELRVAVVDAFTTCDALEPLLAPPDG